MTTQCEHGGLGYSVQQHDGSDDGLDVCVATRCSDGWTGIVLVSEVQRYDALCFFVYTCDWGETVDSFAVKYRYEATNPPGTSEGETPCTPPPENKEPIDEALEFINEGGCYDPPVLGTYCSDTGVPVFWLIETVKEWAGQS